MKVHGRRFILTAAFVAGLICATTCPQAQAEPSQAQEHDAALLCRNLDVDSSPAGVERIVEAMMVKANITAKATAETFALAVIKYCPEYRDEVEIGLDALALKYKQHPVVAPPHVSVSGVIA